MDQSIYAFRGADFRNIINFERDFPNLVSIVLEENYRSTQNILEAAAKVIEKNKIRKAKDLYTRNVKGAEISLFEAMSELEEAEFAIHKIKELMAESLPATIAKLWAGAGRRKSPCCFGPIFSRAFLKKLVWKHNVPYQMVGTQFYSRKEVKDVFAHLRAATNKDDAFSVKRIINVPPRGIGKVSF